MRIGYARVSTLDQNLELQIDALKNAGCERIFTEKISGKSKDDRPELNNMFSKLREGDTVIVWKLDRLGRSLTNLIDLISELNKHGVHFLSLNDNINTQTATGRFTFNIFASLAEFEREIIRERTKAGLNAARSRGRMGGRPKGLSKSSMSKAKAVKVLYEKREQTVEEIAVSLGLSRATCYRYLNLTGDLSLNIGNSISNA